MMTCHVVGGVDTHRDSHVAAVVDELGRVLGTRAFASTSRGYQALVGWLREHGELVRVGVEGTGAYGAGLQRQLQTEGVEVVEVDRPDRKARRRHGKDDVLDAIAAARATLAGTHTTVPKVRTGSVEAVRNLRVARRSAIEQRADTLRQIRTMIVTAPDELSEQLRGLALSKLITRCAAMRPNRDQVADPSTATRIAMRSLARRYQALSDEIGELDELLVPLVADINPRLLELVGVGTDTAAQLLITAGQDPSRIRSEAAFAMLCGAAPLPASSGRTTRHRLNRNGDRQANRALHTIVLVRMRYDQRTRDYVTRRTTEGLSKKEIMRCLKRYVAREVFTVLRQA